MHHRVPRFRLRPSSSQSYVSLDCGFSLSGCSKGKPPVIYSGHACMGWGVAAPLFNCYLTEFGGWKTFFRYVSWKSSSSDLDYFPLLLSPRRSCLITPPPHPSDVRPVVLLCMFTSVERSLLGMVFFSGFWVPERTSSLYLCLFAATFPVLSRPVPSSRLIVERQQTPLSVPFLWIV